MTYTKEQILKAMDCKTADELLELAKSEGVELTREQAEEYIAELGKRKLTDEELKQVAGGIGLDYIIHSCPDFKTASCKKKSK